MYIEGASVAGKAQFRIRYNEGLLSIPEANVLDLKCERK